MKELELIKGFYKPIQPTIKGEQKEVVYQEHRPVGQLSCFVYCFWQLKTSTPLSSNYRYRVVSDGCIDIFFNHKNAQESFVMGFCRKYSEFPIGKEFNYIGIRFFPSVFPLLFTVDAKSLSNRSQELAQVLPRISTYIIQHIKPYENISIVSDKLNDMLVAEIGNRTFNLDSRFYQALHLIFGKKGRLETESDLNTGISPRQLRRIFNYYIGTTPKAFSKVVQFQHILNAKPSAQGLKENKIFFDAGFFDQAHFIKDFKRFYGVTPTQAFR